MRKNDYIQKTIKLQNVVSDIKSKNILFNETYQRKFVWEVQSQEDLICSIFKNIPIGNILIWVTGNSKEIIDGKQRLQSILNFIECDFTICPKLSKEIVDDYIFEIEIENTKEAKLIYKKYIRGENIRLRYDRLPLVLKRAFDIYLILIVELQNTTFADVLSYFDKVNNHKIIKDKKYMSMMPNNFFVNEFLKLDLQAFANQIGFKKNQELLKMIIMFHGIKEQKLNLNSPMSRVLSYTNSVKKVDEIFMGRLKNLIYDFKYFNGSLKTKAEIKLLFATRLLSTNFDGCNIKMLCESISNLVKETKIINSNDPGNKEKILHIRNNFDAYSVTTLFKGQHTLSKILEILKNFHLPF